MPRFVTFDEMKELYEFSLSSNGLKVGFDGTEKEIADGALAAAYEVYRTLGPEDCIKEREAGLLALFAVLMVSVAINEHRKDVDSLKT